MIDDNHLLFAHEGVLPAGSTKVLATTANYDHCNMTVTGDGPLAERFGALLLSMDYGDPEVRRLLELEGLHTWVAGRIDGYQLLERAVDGAGFYDAAGRITAADYRP
jgi:phosphonate transport system substrate-binding protein